MTSTIQKTELMYKGSKIPGFTISTDGYLFGPRGHKMKLRSNAKSNHLCTTIANSTGKLIYFNMAVAMVENFLGLVVRGPRISYKDGNNLNLDINNIVLDGVNASTIMKEPSNAEEYISVLDDAELDENRMNFNETQDESPRLDDFLVKPSTLDKAVTSFDSIVVLDVECPYTKALARLEELGLEDIRRDIRRAALQSLKLIPNFRQEDVTDRELELVKSKIDGYDFASFPFYTSENIFSLHIEHNDVVPIINEKAITTISFKYLRELQMDGYIKSFSQTNEFIAVNLYDTSITMTLCRINDNQEEVLLDLIKLCNMIKRNKPSSGLVSLPF